MSTPPNPRHEHPSTYIVQDRANEDERARLMIQDQMITRGMGGVLPEQTDIASLRSVLDVGCGTGGWLVETATTYPTMSLLIGVDISGKMIEQARSQVAALHLANRIEFHVMDALRMLEFPNDFFDLVNLRFGDSYLRTWDWPNILQEFQRVTRSGGIIRVTESDIVIESTSPALTRLFAIATEAGYRAGHFFTQESDGVTSKLAALLHQHGLLNVQTRAHVLNYRAGTAEGQHFYENMRRTFHTVLPFYRKWTRVPDDYEAIYQQALNEMQQPDFIATWRLLTAWGRCAPK